MFCNRSNKNELLDDHLLNNSELKKNLDEMEILNKWDGSKKLLINALNQIQNKYAAYFNKQHIVIADLGCGNGDLLRAINQWAKSKNLNVKLIGIDANPSVIQYAEEKSQLHNIKYVVENILSPQFAWQQFDIVCLNSVCHHFNDETLIQLFKNLKNQTRLGIIVNDLQRHWLSYFSIKVISKIFNFSSLAKNDGPLSVLRAFRKQELIRLLEEVNITSYNLHWSWAFRWKLLIWLYLKEEKA